MRVEKTVFLSYRRTNVPWALAIFQHLTVHGYDVFFDFTGIASGDFEQIILENIRARAHFLVLLTPSALERVSDPNDWVRREIEVALDTQRNIVPLMLEGFDFSTPGMAAHLTGRIADLTRYNALPVPAPYFTEAMARLRERYLNVPLQAVLHPNSAATRELALQQQYAATLAPAVEEGELTAQESFEQACYTADPAKRERLCSRAIDLKPDYADAFFHRGRLRCARGDVAGALEDCDIAIRLQPDSVGAFIARGGAREQQGDVAGAREDYDTAVRLGPDDVAARCVRGLFRRKHGDAAGALNDCDTAIRLLPNSQTFFTRGLVHMYDDAEAAVRDFDMAERLRGPSIQR